MPRKPKGDRPKWADKWLGEEEAYEAEMQARPKDGWIGDSYDCGTRIIEPAEDYVPNGHSFTIFGMFAGPALLFVLALIGTCGGK